MSSTIPEVLGISNISLGYFWYLFQNERKEEDEKRFEEWVGIRSPSQMGHVQGESGNFAEYQRFIIFFSHGAIGCDLWKSLITSGAFLRLVSTIHLFSSEGNPYQWTRYSIFPHLSLEARISSISYSSILLMRSGGGGGVVFCDGHIPWWYGWRRYSLNMLWIPHHFGSNFNR